MHSRPFNSSIHRLYFIALNYLRDGTALVAEKNEEGRGFFTLIVALGRAVAVNHFYLYYSCAG